MVEQLKKYNHPIILLDNFSKYKPLFEYYKEIKSELKNKIEIRLLKKNYGNTVYLALKHTLPSVYILTDPDIELNKNMPINFAETLFNLSNKYKMYKIGLALSVKNKDSFLDCNSPNSSKTIYEYNAELWKSPIKDSTYQLYDAFVDTTFCLVNSKFRPRQFDLPKDYMSSTRPAIRIAGNFTAKHLPWYKKSLSEIPKNQLGMYVRNSKSSTVVHSCIRPMFRKSIDKHIEKIND